jgi:putative phosphoesterase
MVERRMKLGVISDIHANIAALDAVLADMPAVDRLICCGDIVEYYADPNEVCDRLRALSPLVVRGNHDAYVIGALGPSLERRAAYRTDWTRDALRPDNMEWLKSLPTEQRLTEGDREVVVRHASPWDEETYLYPDSPRLDEIRLGSRQILLVGHTHIPLHRTAGGGMIVNPGSVGQPRDWDPRAAYATVDLATGIVEHRRVAYDVGALQTRLRNLGWDPAMIKILGRERQEV